MINKRCKYCTKIYERVKQSNGIDRDFNMMYTEVEIERYKCYNEHVDNDKPMSCEHCKYKKVGLFGGIGR